MVGIVMAHLKYLCLDILLRYFDHFNRVPCVSMESFSKNCSFSWSLGCDPVWEKSRARKQLILLTVRQG
jgi:hypothetical protein